MLHLERQWLCNTNWVHVLLNINQPFNYITTLQDRTSSAAWLDKPVDTHDAHVK